MKPLQCLSVRVARFDLAFAALIVFLYLPGSSLKHRDRLCKLGFLYPLRRNDYQKNSVNIFSCNCPGAITGFCCRAPETNSPKIVCNSPWGSYRISCRAPENNSKIIFSWLYSNHFESEGILGDTPKPRQLKAPGRKPTIKQLKEARKGNGPARKGNRWPRKGHGWPINRNQRPFSLSKMPLFATVPLTALIVGAHAELLRNGQN